MKAKRLVAMLAAVVLIVGIVAVPAMASDEGIQPHVCSHVRTESNYTKYGEAYTVRADACPNYAPSHNHFMQRYRVVVTCSTCGAIVRTYTTVEESCPHA